MNSFERIEYKASDALRFLRTGDGERVASLLRSILAVCRSELNRQALALPRYDYCTDCEQDVPMYGPHACRGGKLVTGGAK